MYQCGVEVWESVQGWDVGLAGMRVKRGGHGESAAVKDTVKGFSSYYFFMLECKMK